MANTYSRLYVHVIFGTKQRKPLLNPEIRPRLWTYLSGIAISNNIKMLEVGGMADHVHLLLLVPPTIPISKGIQLLKGGSSKWLNDQFFPDRRFRWQKGYSAFSVSRSGLQAVVRYIQNQEEHHRRRSFRREYLQFLRHHQIVFNPDYAVS